MSVLVVLRVETLLALSGEEDEEELTKDELKREEGRVVASLGADVEEEKAEEAKVEDEAGR
jgi:hypothetical protein